MAHSIWVPLLLLCTAFRGSVPVPRHVSQGQVSISTNGTPMDIPTSIMSELKKLLPPGIDPSNVNLMSITCTDLNEELASVNKQLEEKTRLNTELGEEAFVLRQDVRALNAQLARCNSAASAITDSYQIQLENQIKELLEMIEGDSFQLLQLISLVREMTVLEDKLKHGSNYSQIEITELKERLKNLEQKKLQFMSTQPNSELILQIIMLQNAIWKLEQEESKGGEPVLGQSRNMTGLQAQLAGLIFQLRREDSNSSALLELMAVQTKITMIQNLINIYIKKYKRINDDYQRQLKQKSQLLTAKILRLGNEKKNTVLTNEILVLQQEINHLTMLMSKTAKSETQIKVLIVSLETEKKKQEQIQKKLEEADYVQAQMLLKAINMMKELRELQSLEKKQSHKTSSSSSTLQTLLETKEREYLKAQEKIKELEIELQKKNKEFAGLEGRFTQLKGDFDRGIVELHTHGDDKVALVLSVSDLNNELRNLRGLISATDNLQKKAELQWKLEGKEQELKSLTAELKKYLSNPDQILNIIKYQNEITDLQKNQNVGDAAQRLAELPRRVYGLISNIQDDEILKQTLKIMMLQNQVEQLKKELSLQDDISPSQLKQLQSELEAKQADLERVVAGLRETDKTTANIILKLTILSTQMNKIQEDKQTQGEVGLATIKKLKRELQAHEEQHRQDQEQITTLQKRLEQTEIECSNQQQTIKDLQNDIDAKMKELGSESDIITSLVVQISTLNMQQEELRRQLANTQSTSKIAELQKQIEEKTKEIEAKTAQLKAKSPNSRQFIQIIDTQARIEKLSHTAKNETDYNRILALQDHLTMLVNSIHGINTDVTKQALKMFTAQQEVMRLQNLKETETKVLNDKIKDLENELGETRTKINEKTLSLETSGTRIVNLTNEIMELHQKIKPLEDVIAQLKETYKENLREVQERLDQTRSQLENSEREMRDADAKTYKLLIEISDLKTQLKKTQREATKTAGKHISDLEEKLETQEKENRKLEISNQELTLEVRELKKCCNDINAHCGDLQKQLEQSNSDAVIMGKQLQAQATKLKDLEQELEKERKNSDNQEKLQELQIELQQCDTHAKTMNQHLKEREDALSQAEEKLSKCTAEQSELDKRSKVLQTDIEKLENLVEDLQVRLDEGYRQTIHGRILEFDLDTAHPRITLSRNNQEVNTVDQPQDVHDHPQRFDVLLAVLGKTGYSSGRNYWEVSIGDKNCFHLGMVSESAQRRGTTLFNPANGFWTVVLTKKNEYRALDLVPVTIPVVVKPLTVGILLDYVKGQVSFYNAGARSHIYTFQSQHFTEKMYPFINFCVETPHFPTPIISVAPGSVDWLQSA